MRPRTRARSVQIPFTLKANLFLVVISRVRAFTSLLSLSLLSLLGVRVRLRVGLLLRTLRARRMGPEERGPRGNGGILRVRIVLDCDLITTQLSDAK